MTINSQTIESPAKTNRLAIVSFVSGLMVIALNVFGLYWLSFPASIEAWNTIRPILDLSVSVQYICAPVALFTGILALREIKKKDGTEKGKILSWMGIVLGAGYILFGALVFIMFSVAEILN
jgi:hypothetical protein